MSSKLPPRQAPQPPPPKIVSIQERRGSQFNQVTLDQVAPVGPSPLWEGYLYRGTYTLLSGDPGTGKTSVACDLIARASRGGPFPHSEETFEPVRCLILASEDSAGTFRRRIEAGQGVLSRIGFINSRPAPLLTDLDHLLDGIGLLFIETLEAHIPPTSGSDNTAVRQVLLPLLKALEERNCAGLTVRHWNKVGGQGMMQRSSGAMTYVAASRAALATSMDGARNRFLSAVRTSLAKEKPPLRFDLGHENTIQWGEYDFAASPGLTAELSDVVEFLRRELADGPQPAKAVRAAATGSGIPYKLLHDAKVYLCIKPRRIGFSTGSHWEWGLPMIADEGPSAVDLRTLGEEPGEWDPSS